MPAGDSLKTWFTPVIMRLTSSWSHDLKWDEVINLCVDLTKIRNNYRNEQGIQGQKMWCPECQSRHQFSPGPISITALLSALLRYGVINAQEADLKTKEWKKYQRKNKLNSSGHPLPPQ
jgi:hypothetical protein